jgi:hypothetical protein
MTYKQLAKWIDTLTPEQQECDVIVYDGEYHPLEGVFCEDESDVLDKDHPVLEI